MTKTEIAKLLWENVDGFTKAQALEYVDLIFDQLKQALARGEHVKISGFGKFMVRDKKERIGRNPQTGEEIVIDARTVVTFKSSEVLRATVNNKKD